MLCGEIETVQAATADGARHFPVEDTAAAVLRFASGALGTLILSDAVSAPWSWEWSSYENPFWPHESQNCYFVTGTRGALTVPSLERGGTSRARAGRIRSRAGAFRTRRPTPTWSRCSNFADVIRGQAEPVVSGWERRAHPGRHARDHRVGQDWPAACALTSAGAALSPSRRTASMSRDDARGLRHGLAGEAVALADHPRLLAEAARHRGRLPHRGGHARGLSAPSSPISPSAAMSAATSPCRTRTWR